jgi:hypothetical protein
MSADGDVWDVDHANRRGGKNKERIEGNPTQPQHGRTTRGENMWEAYNTNGTDTESLIQAPGGGGSLRRGHWSAVQHRRKPLKLTWPSAFRCASARAAKSSYGVDLNPPLFAFWKRT